MKSFISLEEAIKILNLNVEKLESEEVSLINAVGRVLEERVYSKINNPPFNKSAMDGYAVIAEDTLKDNSNLEVVDEIFAGGFSNVEVTCGKAIKIMTGAPIPLGANAVIKQEDITKREKYIEINKSVVATQNICFKGEDIKVGDILVDKGKKLNYADIGIMASAGISTVRVYKKPKIAFISTGDEVVDINEELVQGKIYNSNKYSILSRINELGYEVTYINHINDSFAEIGEEIRKASKDVELVITTGGASVGEKDLTKEAIDYIDGEKLFWKILIKPGSAILCSKFNNTFIISLSGNPTAALTTFELIARTTLEKLSGKDEIRINREKAILMDDILKKSPQRRFLRGRVSSEEAKQQVYLTQFKSGNGILSSTLDSNCLIEIEAGNEGVKKGEVVDIIKF